MEMTSERRIAADQGAVWRALNDPEVLKSCIPGCEAVERETETDYRVVMVAAVGPVRAKFKGKLGLRDLDPPNSYLIVFDGQGGPAGFGKGEAKVTLLPDGDGTILRYAAKAQVGGKLAQIGSRLVDAAARKVADDFFAAFDALVAPPKPQAAVGGTTEAAAPVPAPRKGPPSWLLWTIGIIVVAVLIFLTRRAG